MVGQGPNVSQDVRRLVALLLVLVVNATVLPQALALRNNTVDDGQSAHTVTRLPRSAPGQPTRFHLELPMDNRWELDEASKE